MGMKDDPKTVELKSGATAEIAGKPSGEALNVKITVASEGDKDKKEKKPLRGLQAFRNA